MQTLLTAKSAQLLDAHRDCNLLKSVPADAAVDPKTKFADGSDEEEFFSYDEEEYHQDFHVRVDDP